MEEYDFLEAMETRRTAKPVVETDEGRWSFREAMQRKPARTQPVELVAPLDPARVGRYAAAAIDDECRSVATTPEGGRNDRLNIAGFKLSQLIAAGHAAEATVRAALTDAARTAGLPDGEIAATLRSAFDAGMQQPRIVPELTQAPDVTVLDDDIADPAAIDARFPTIVFDETFWTSADDTEWIVEPILPARRLVALYSPAKVGKSLLMLEVAVKVARGERVLGYLPDRPRRVLYLDFENDPLGDVRPRLQSMGFGPGDDLTNLAYLSFPPLPKLDTDAGAIDLLRLVERHDSEVVFIDTISRAITGEENSNDTWLALYRKTGLALKRRGVACLRLDHSGKDHERGMRGGSAKSGDVDAVWSMSKVTDATLRLECTEHRMPIAEKRLVICRETLPHLHHVVQAEGRMAAKRLKIAEVIDTLDKLDAPVRVARRAAAELLKTTGVKVENATLGDALEERRLRRQVVQIGDGG